MGGPIVNFELGINQVLPVQVGVQLNAKKPFPLFVIPFKKFFMLPSIKSFVLVSIISSLYSTLKISLAREGTNFFGNFKWCYSIIIAIHCHREI